VGRLRQYDHGLGKPQWINNGDKVGTRDISLNWDVFVALSIPFVTSSPQGQWTAHAYAILTTDELLAPLPS
jgi:hypothetical protein